MGQPSILAEGKTVANIANRSAFLITCPGKNDTKIKLKSKAQAYLESLKNSKAKMVQLDTSWEAQIKLKDKEGNVIQLSKTHNSEAKAIKWAEDEEARILEYKRKNGKFDTTFETMTIEVGLNQLVETYYITMASYTENKTRAKQITDYFGKNKLLKDITPTDIRNYRDHLKNEGYSASSVRNFFAVVSRLFKYAKSEWLFNIANPTEGIHLDRPDNTVERYWEGKDEKERLFISIDKYRPYLRDIVELCLDLTFRIGELVPKSLKEINSEKGLMWKGVDFENGRIRIFHEKNDHTKRNTELKGREVPMTKKARVILTRLYEQSETKTGRVFNTSYNTLRPALKFVCEHAEPPIKKFGWHSTRKIGVSDLSKRVNNLFQMVAISGHKTLQIAKDRYWKSDIEELKELLDEIDTNNPVLRGLLLLEKHLGKDTAEEVVKYIRETKLQKKYKLLEQLKIVSEEIILEVEKPK